ncbi:hypothetical protein XA68_10886 [Ophiocordyceps unilateralis]|uniref:Uncharacterized protein n=1 Tax=Ophiocordyceps unilateralis TaxID=268505 RepID=A0A2A9P2E7_OPHUN|nr:hypothetical protein XA68_10886 [Ophiocordyceps unilateralis]
MSLLLPPPPPPPPPPEDDPEGFDCPPSLPPEDPPPVSLPRQNDSPPCNRCCRRLALVGEVLFSRIDELVHSDRLASSFQILVAAVNVNELVMASNTSHVPFPPPYLYSRRPPHGYQPQLLLYSVLDSRHTQVNGLSSLLRGIMSVQNRFVARSERHTAPPPEAHSAPSRGHSDKCKFTLQLPAYAYRRRVVPCLLFFWAHDPGHAFLCPSRPRARHA